MSDSKTAETFADPEETIRALQKELEETNSGLVALTLELEQRVDARTAELREAHGELQKTNSELLQLTLELEERVAQRTEDIRKLNEQLESRVRKRTAELQAANEELEAFTYSVSHDLRAPLRHLDGFSKLLVEKHRAELSPDAQEYVATIRDSVLQMGMLIDDLLNLARVGRKQLSIEVTGLNSLVEEVRADLKRSNPDRVIEWKVDTLPFVECDPGLMKQVFANLLSNAVKFTRPRKPAVIEVGAVGQDGARYRLRARQRRGLQHEVRQQTLWGVSAPAPERKTSKAPASAWPRSSALFINTEGASGRRLNSIRARPSISPWDRRTIPSRKNQLTREVTHDPRGSANSPCRRQSQGCQTDSARFE